MFGESVEPRRLMSYVVLFGFVLASLLVPQPGDGVDVRARAAQASGEPVAMIQPLPDIVSNGTWMYLDASGSYDPDGVIVNYTWRIVIGNETVYLYGKVEPFKFTTLGLYKIYLTVRDDMGNTAIDFWAVFSIKDVDDDSLPDWWEVKYFRYNPDGPLAYGADDDPDGDGYTNLQEYLALTDPTDPSSHPLSFWDRYLLHIILILVAIGVVVGVSIPLLLRRHRALDRKKIEYAIEIEKELDKELEENSREGEGRKK